jgi:hypothetical protein
MDTHLLLTTILDILRVLHLILVTVDRIVHHIPTPTALFLLLTIHTKGWDLLEEQREKKPMMIIIMD